ncbi:hypothetical protein DM860_018228 [Cuscuta australis]|uniref:Protein SLOW GREEN 1, chloroplastic n=1 Tax=Cuscuta australis TaxID=267555 RepID=A0A328D8F8_9ASTE|nr:hypothetical protein DM860_018228 [Cuscuta australis]
MCSSSISRCPIYLHLTPNRSPSSSFPIFPSSLKPFSLNPVSKTPRIVLIRPHLHQSKSAPENCSFTPQKVISRPLGEQLVILIFGSFVFFCSCLKGRAAMARPVQESSWAEEKAQVGETDEVRLYLKLLEKDPGNIESLKMIVNAMMKRGRTKEAVQYVERLIEVQPGEVEWRLLQALCYEMMGQLSKAKRLFKQVLKQKPLSLRALHGLAMVMHKNHEGPAVFEMLNGALEVARREKRVNEERNIKILIAQMHAVNGELEEALEMFQNLVQENPKDFRPYLCQGIVYSLLGKKKEAEDFFETYHNLVPQEFPGRGFLEDVMLAAKTQPKERLEKEFAD